MFEIVGVRTCYWCKNYYNKSKIDIRKNFLKKYDIDKF